MMLLCEWLGASGLRCDLLLHHHTTLKTLYLAWCECVIACELHHLRKDVNPALKVSEGSLSPTCLYAELL